MTGTTGPTMDNNDGDTMAADASPIDLMDDMITHSGESNEDNDEYTVSDSEEENEQPTSSYQPFTTAMAGIPAPPLTPPQAVPLMLTNGNPDMTTDSDEVEEFEDGEYIVSDDTQDDDNMGIEDNDESDDDNDIPPEITE